MRPLFALLLLTIAPIALAEKTATWAEEFVNTKASPERLLIARAWFPVAEPDEIRPLLLLAPGRGVASIAYARVGEFLAGHGFVVVAVDSPGSGRLIFADGRVIDPDPALVPPPGLMAGPYVEVDRFFAAAATAGAGDLRFVLDRIAAASDTDAIPFAGQVDTGRVGLLGHSLGGRIAGAFAASDSRVAAWLGIEGVAPRELRRQGLGVPAMAILGDGIWPYAIDNVRELAWCAQQPTYLVRMASIQHNSILESEPAGVMPDEQYRLAMTIRNFFEHHLTSSDTYMKPMPDALTVEHFDAPAAFRPQQHSCNG